MSSSAVDTLLREEGALNTRIFANTLSPVCPRPLENKNRSGWRSALLASDRGRWALAVGLSIAVHLSIAALLPAPSQTTPPAQGVRLSVSLIPAGAEGQAGAARTSVTTGKESLTSPASPAPPAASPDTVAKVDPPAPPSVPPAKSPAVSAHSARAQIARPRAQPMPKAKPQAPRSQPIRAPLRSVRPVATTKPAAESEHPRTAPQPGVEAGGKSAGQMRQGNGETEAGKETNGLSGSVGNDANAQPLAGNPRPRYPFVARQRGQEGRVVIRVAVQPDGTIADAEIRLSSGHSLLDEAALETVRRWQFQPARRAGRATGATIDVPIVFRLESG